MTRDERQLIRMMNRSFKDKKQSRNIEIKDLTDIQDESELKSEFDNLSADDTIEDFDSWNEETDEVFDEYKPLIQHFVLKNPWLPYEKDLRLNKFVIHQNNSVDLEFDIIFNRPPHLKNEPSDLNDPLNVLRRFYSLMGKSDNIKCSISYTDAPDDVLQKGLTLYSISGTITSMEILQNYGLGLRIKVKGEIIIRDENRR